MHRNLFALAAILAMLAAAFEAGAACTAANPNASVSEATPTGDLTDNGDGTVTHSLTGLMWKQCAEGLSGAGCATGAATAMTWGQALVTAKNANFASRTDWRLPNKKELESLPENCGSNPSINQTRFPVTPASYFWSGSSYVPDPANAWMVSFNDGDIVAGSKAANGYVRLVRGGLAIESFDAQSVDTTPDAFTFTAQTGVAISTVATSNTITVAGINSAANIGIVGGTYSINGGGYTAVAGTVNNGDTVTVRQTSSGSYSTLTTATLTIGGVSGAFDVTTLGSQTITFGAAPAIVVGGSGTVSATGGASGNAVTFTVPTTTGVCSITGSTVTGLAAGTCTVAANQAGNGNYNAAPQATQNITIGKANQTITFGAAPGVTVGGTGTASATGGASGLPVTFTSATTGICTVSGSTVTGIAAGTCTIRANQAGNANYSAAPQATQTITVAKRSQTIGPITFAPATLKIGGTTTAGAAATSGLPVTFSTASPACTATGTAQTVTLRNTGTAALGITGIVASGNFARTTTCGAALAAGASCTISATFTPTAMGARTGAVTITSNAPGSPHRIALAGTGQGARYDMNGDGKADIFWRNTTSGANQIWFMNGAARIGAPATPLAQPAGWSIAGEADFNADGKADLLWRNAAGQNQIWLMNGATRLSATILSPAMIAPWTFAGTGDFNNDGKADLFWRNTATGANRVWLMNGAARIGAPVNAAAQAVAWAVAGIADFNGDGKADLLWRNAATGQNQVWFMNGATRTGVGAVPGTIKAPWIIAGTGDFNGDGKADLLWRNPNTGGNTVWLMNGAAATGRTTAAQATGWQVAGVADFSGDGKADILWRNPASGAAQLWPMNGAARVSFANLAPAMPAPWVVAK